MSTSETTAPSTATSDSGTPGVLSADERRERLAFVKRSPDAANRKARAEWLGLYASDAIVGDPVGTPECRKDHDTRGGGDSDLGRFYDMFIAGMKSLEVDVHRDIVVGDVVARDVTLRPTMAFGVKNAIPTHLLYELGDEGGRLVVKRLGAHWEASQATKRTLSHGLRGKASMMVSTARMMRILGRDWVQRYVEGTKRGIRRPGRESAVAFAQALRESDAEGLRALCTDDAVAELPGAGPAPMGTLLGKGLELRLKDPIASGWVVSAACTARDGDRDVAGLVFLEFDPEARRIQRARFFWE